MAINQNAKDKNYEVVGTEFIDKYYVLPTKLPPPRYKRNDCNIHNGPAITSTR